jgi:nucleotide sugar dehydrogenase
MPTSTPTVAAQTSVTASATAVVVGQGYVGLPLAQGIISAGVPTTGFDLNTATIDQLTNGVSHIDDLSDDDISMMLDAGYRASADPQVLADADVIIICVPTPLTDAGAPDLRAIEGAARMIATNLTPGTLVVLESTTYPGTTNDVVLPILESSGLRLDRDFFLAFSPERIDPGNPLYGLRNTPKVVGGVSAASTERARAFYSRFIDTVVTTRSAREAETAKLLENTYRHINIALVNEMAKFCYDLGIDIWDVIHAASTKPFGFQAFYPGPGVGGHCIPIDPNYLSYEVQRRLGYPFRFVELAEEINSSMPAYVVSRVQDALNDRERALRGTQVLVLGVTYKADISDQRESSAIPVAKLLGAKGANIQFHDPHVKTWRLGEVELERVPNLSTAIAQADVVILLQAHTSYDLDAIAASSAIFFDTRGKAHGANVIKL